MLYFSRVYSGRSESECRLSPLRIDPLRPALAPPTCPPRTPTDRPRDVPPPGRRPLSRAARAVTCVARPQSQSGRVARHPLRITRYIMTVT